MDKNKLKKQIESAQDDYLEQACRIMGISQRNAQARFDNDPELAAALEVVLKHGQRLEALAHEDPENRLNPVKQNYLWWN